LLLRKMSVCPFGLLDFSILAILLLKMWLILFLSLKALRFLFDLAWLFL